MRFLMRLSAVSLVVALSLLVAAPVGAANDPYIVGAVVSESGPAATLGRPAADSITMAVAEINAAGGVNGQPIQLTILDDQSDPTTAVNALRKLLDMHPIAVIGSSGTPPSLAMVPVANAAGVPLISLGSSSAIIDPATDHWIFKIPVADTYIAQRILTSMKLRGFTRVGVVYRDDDYGKSGLARVQQLGGAYGVQVVDAEPIAATATDATTQLTRIKGANPQAVLVWTTLPSATVVVKAYRELALPYTLYYSEGSANPIFLTQAGAATNGILFVTEKAAVADAIGNDDPQKRALTHYATTFAQQYPKDGPPSIFGGFGYDAVYVLAEGLKRGGASPSALRDALEHVTYTGVSGSFHTSPSDHNGLGIDAVELVQVENGKFVVVRRAVTLPPPPRSRP
jgi:branched-chain amino acid transport system substrate-binding protein